MGKEEKVNVFNFAHARKMVFRVIPCFPMEKENCRNILPTARKKLDLPLSLAQNKMFQAFGMTMLNSDGAPRLDLWDKIWEKVIRLRGKQY